MLNFRYFIAYEDNKEFIPFCTYFPEMSVYKIYSDKIKRMYFLIKDENFFDKYMTVWEKASDIIIRKFNSDLVYNKIYLKVKKISAQKKAFNIFIYH